LGRQIFSLAAGKLEHRDDIPISPHFGAWKKENCTRKPNGGTPEWEVNEGHVGKIKKRIVILPEKQGFASKCCP